MSSVAMPVEAGGPVTDEHGVVFVLGDRYRRLAGVRLQQDLGLGGAVFTRERTQWSLRIPRPPVDRMEYLYEIEDYNGHRSTITDPANPLRAPGAFGDKSVVEFAEYVRPAWLDSGGVDGTAEDFAFPAPLLDSELTGAVWAPTSLTPDEPAPLLVVHDGPEFASLGGFVHCVAASIAAGELPPARVLLLGPGERNDWYSANDAYADTLAALLAADVVAPATVRVGVGVSLGALAMLHMHRRHPGTIGGLFLQSGSFFTADLDGQESHFSGFAAVTAFVAGVHEAEQDDDPVPTTITCGIPEENLPNNQRMAATLGGLGYATAVHTVRDAHNYTAWRDALHPYLPDLVRSVVTSDAS